MKIKVNEASGPVLDWMVAKCEGRHELAPFWVDDDKYGNHIERPFSPSTDWSQGGPIIEREGITTVFCSGDLGEPRNYWAATAEQQGWQWGYGPYHERDEDRSLQIYKPGIAVGPTLLIAAMRCYVASKLGNEVEVPEGLK